MSHLLSDLRALMHAPQAVERPANIVVNTISKPRPWPDEPRLDIASGEKRDGRSLRRMRSLPPACSRPVSRSKPASF